jgi:hypothetical protein
MTSFGRFGLTSRLALGISNTHPKRVENPSIQQRLPDEIELAADQQPSVSGSMSSIVKGPCGMTPRRRLEREFDLREANLVNHQHED